MSFNPEQAILEALRKWRRLAEAEGLAIRTRNWQAVAECQSSIQTLQPHLDSCAQTAREDWRRLGSEGDVRRGRFQALAAELAELSRQNESAIEQQRQKLAARFSQLGCSSRNLRRVQQSYVPATPAAWSSVS